MPSAHPPVAARARVLVVEDDRNLRELLCNELEELDLQVQTVARSEEALPLLETHAPQVIISDLRLPGSDGIALLRHSQPYRAQSGAAFILITAFGSIDQAVEALKQGADEFLTKPLDLDHLRIRVERLLDVQRLRRDVSHFRQLAEQDFHGLVGRSPAMQRLFSDIRKLADGRGTVLILGESGAGKELVARAIHRESSRRERPFVPVNCAGIPATLMESEFFGHEPGAFTGATRARHGLFAEADGGTILLDEVGELPLELQAKLLRILQDGVVRPVGSNRSRNLDVRVLVATHRDLEREVADGRFREDLYYRLATFVLEVPPLRARSEDIGPLASHFLQRFERDDGRCIKGFSAAAAERLASHSFPGNVRELANIVEYAATFARGPHIELDELPRLKSTSLRSPRGADDLRSDTQAATGITNWPLQPDGTLATLDQLSLRYVRHVLELTRGNKRRAAALLGISRRTLYRHLGKLSSDDQDA